MNDEIDKLEKEASSREDVRREELREDPLGEARQSKSPSKVKFFGIKNPVASLGKKLFKVNKRMSEGNESSVETRADDNATASVDTVSSEIGVEHDLKSSGEVSQDPSQESEGDGKSDVEKLRTELAAANAALAAMKEDLLRSQADAINAQKRHAKERAQLLRYQGENFFRDFLEFMDNLERAIASEGDAEVLREGVSMVYKSLLSLLEKWEIKSEDPAGQPFDHEKCAAISVVEGTPTGIVAQVLKKPFWYRDKLIRPGEVVVGK